MKISTLVTWESEKSDLSEHGKLLEKMCKKESVEIFALAEYWDDMQDINIRRQKQESVQRTGGGIVVLTCSDDGIDWALHQDLPVAAFRGKAYEAQHGRQELFGAPFLFEDADQIDLEVLTRIWQRKEDLPWEIGRTKRCVIREIGKSDLPCLYELMNGNINKDSLYPMQLSREEFFTFWNSYRENMYRLCDFGYWLVCLGHEIIGMAGIGFADYGGGQETELGYWIRSSYRHQGYAREACEFVLRYASEELEMNEISVYIRAENKASISLAEKLGFQKIRQFETDGCRVQRYTKSLQFD